MAKNKIDFLREIEIRVNDNAQELCKKATITAREDNTPEESTTFTLNSVKGFYAGDEVYLFDGTVNSKFYSIASIDSALKKIVISGEVNISTGGTVMKTNAVMYLNEALTEYSRVKPLEVVFTIEGSNNFIYPLPEGWDNNIDLIKSVEYPAGNNPPVYIDEYTYKLYRDENGILKIRFMSNIANGYLAMVTYHGEHSFTGDNPYTITAPDSDFHAIVNLASSKYLFALAAYYGQSMNNTISADVVNYDNKTDSYRRLAKEYLAQAASMLGCSVDEFDGGKMKVKAASSTQMKEIGRRRTGIFN